jgi:hypothetical protein
VWPPLRLSWWRFRATFGQRWSGYLGIVLVVGLLGGLSMAAVAGARRTQSSFPAYLASTSPSDVQMFTEFGPFTHTGYSSKVEDSIARLPYVTKSADVIGFVCSGLVRWASAPAATPAKRRPRSREA